MLILAGVSIATLTGENGILTRANDAKRNTEQAEEDELRKLTQAEAATHLEDYEHTDVSGKKVNIPAKCAVSQVEGENTVKDGLIIIDANGNEWVWIEIANDGSGPNYNNVSNSTEYDKIEQALQEYVKDYKSSDSLFSDTWTSESNQGLTQDQYNMLKEKMLKNIYEDAGFFVARYETGSEKIRNTQEVGIPTDKAVIKADVYPYNYVTCKQAQNIASTLTPNSNYTSTLLFGIQWDLVCKFIEKNSDKLSEEDIKGNSISWGNFASVSFDISKGKYSLDQGKTYTEVKGKFTKEVGVSAILTTGATTRNSALNIFDLSGNVFEWTLENSGNVSNPCVLRGGVSGTEGADPVVGRNELSNVSGETWSGSCLLYTSRCV